MTGKPHRFPELQPATSLSSAENLTRAGYGEIGDLLRMAVGHSPETVQVLDPAGKVLYANRVLPGMRAGAILGSSLFDAIPDRWQSVMGECIAKVLVSGQPGSFEIEAAEPGDRSRFLEGRVVPISAAGSVRLLLVSTRDVTDRKQVENKLRVDADRYRFLTETISDVIWTMDLDQTITYVSPSIESLIGFSESDMAAMPFSEFLAPESFALARETLLEELRLESDPRLDPARTRTLDLQLRRKDGSTIWCEARMSFLRHTSGRPTGVLGVARDMSSWREAQEALEASEERLRRAQRLEAVGQLAGGVAHDFNNLLTVIIGNVELMLKELPTDDLLRTQAGEISKAAERAASLTRQLLAFSRKQVMMPQSLNLNNVVEDMAGMLRGLIGENIELKLDLYPALARVKVDPSQIELALVNLALNARDAMANGGRLQIETVNAHLDAKQFDTHFSVAEGPYALLAVSDTGNGIDPEDQAKVFEPFFTTKQIGKGTGLGLSTVYGIVKQSGGYIWATSPAGRGARFEIYLPRDSEATAEIRAPIAQPVAQTGSETVLLVEDEDSVRSLTSRILRDRGYEVFEAPDAETAIELLATDGEAVELVVTDVILPGMNGAQLAEQLVHARPDLQVLYISGHSDDMLTRCGQLDASTNFLEKPFSPDALIRKVRQILDDRLPQGEVNVEKSS